MKVLVTGVGGQLGYDVVNELIKRNHEAVGSDILDNTNINEESKYIRLDITDKVAVEQVIASEKPDAVIHCAAWTAVDLAEDEDKQEKVFAINADGTRYIAEACRKIDCKMIYISTDYVFDGTKKGFYEVDDIPNPINTYGQSKLAGEKSVQEIMDKYFIMRISWAFGMNGYNFVKTMLSLGKERSELNVVTDQIGSPTYTADLASLLVDMLETEEYGIYHATNEGECTWAEFAEEIFKIAGMNVKVNHISAAKYPAKAKRPMNSRMSKEKLIECGFGKLRSWDEAVKDYIKWCKDE